MRLTTNGYLFLGIGAAAIGAAYFMNIPPLRAVGLLLIVLPLLSLLSLAGRGGRVTVDGVRFDCPDGRSTPEEGAESPLRFTVRNLGGGSSPAGSLSIAASETLGISRTLAIPPLPPHASVEIELTCRPAARGKQTLGPFTARRHGVLSLAARTIECLPARQIAVGPRMFAVPGLEHMAHNRGGLGQRSVRHGFDIRDFTTRSYERGDDIRFVHWGSTARHGELMVRHEAGSDAPAAAVVLDTYEAGYPRRKYFEWSVCAAAAATWALLRAGHDVDFVTQARPVERFSCGAGRQEVLDRCLTVFAEIMPTGPAAAPATNTPVHAGIVVALTGSSARGAARLSELTADGGTALRFALCHDEDLLGALAEHRFIGSAIDPRTTSVVEAWTRALAGAGR